MNYANESNMESLISTCLIALFVAGSIRKTSDLKEANVPKEFDPNRIHSSTDAKILT